MNQPDSFDRLRRQIQAASQQVRLTPGSEIETIRAAHGRRTRTRALVGTAAAVAVGTGTVVAVQQLGKTGTEGFAVGTGDGTAPDNAVAPVTEPSGTTPATSAPIGTVPGGGWDIPTQPALPADSAYTWNATTVDAANSVMGFWQGRVPGVIISTAPGRAADPNQPAVQQAYFTEDGITFETLDVALPGDLNRGGRLFADGDSIYAVGTAPGVAETARNPLLVEVSDDRGASWTTVELPIDTHETRQLPFVSSGYDTQVVPTDAGPVVLVQSWTGFDSRDVAALDGVDHWRVTGEGVAVADPDCMEVAGTAVATIAPAAEAPTTTAVRTTETTVQSDTAVVTGPITVGTSPGSIDACFTEVRTWAELGVPDESVPYLTERSVSQVFRIVDGQPVEVSLPEGVTEFGYGVSFQGCTLNGPCESYELGADGTWHASDVPDPIEWGGGVVASATHQFASIGTPTNERLIAASAGGEWTYTDVAPLLPDFGMFEAWSERSAATEDGFAQVGPVRTDVVAEQGGVSLQTGSFTVGRASQNAPLVVTETATGGVIAASESWLENGDVQLVGPDGAVLATLTSAEHESLYAYDESPEWAILTTADGVHVAIESAAELAGVADDDITGLRVNAVGRQLIVTVVLKSESAPGVKDQIVLVGTPNE